MGKWKMECKECKTKGDCQKAFGLYWAYKSHMGEGCDLPFAYKTTLEKMPAEERKAYEEVLP